MYFCLYFVSKNDIFDAFSKIEWPETNALHLHRGNIAKFPQKTQKNPHKVCHNSSIDCGPFTITQCFVPVSVLVFDTH